MKLKIEQNDIENIIIAMEIHTKEYIERYGLLQNKISEWVNNFGDLPPGSMERLDDIRNDIFCLL